MAAKEQLAAVSILYRRALLRRYTGYSFVGSIILCGTGSVKGRGFSFTAGTYGMDIKTLLRFAAKKGLIHAGSV